MIARHEIILTQSVCRFKLLDRVIIELVYGNLENEETDVIVNLTDAELKNEGLRSNRLAEKAGMRFQDDCNYKLTKQLQSFNEGSCIEVNPGNLKCEVVINSIALSAFFLSGQPKKLTHENMVK